MSHKKDEILATRASLLERMKNWQDETSWQDFFNSYWKLIYGVARKSGLSDTEAQDVVQEVMAAVAREMPGFKYDPAKGSFKSWLLIKTRWKIVDQFRKRGPLAKEPLHSGATEYGTDPVEQLPDPASLVPDAIWEDEWKESLFAVAMAKVRPKLDPEKAQIFDFYAIKGWKAEKVAEAFHVSVEHVHMTKYRVKEMIEAEVRRLERQGT